MFKWLYNKIKNFYDNEYYYEKEFEISIYDIILIILFIFFILRLWM